MLPSDYLFAGQPCYGETGDIKPWPPSPGPADPQYDLPSKGELFLTYAREVNIRVCGELQVAVETGNKLEVGGAQPSLVFPNSTNQEASWLNQ